MRGHVQLRGAVAEHIVDEPRGEIEPELASERFQGPFNAHAVPKDAVKHQGADLVVVLGLGPHALGGSAEGGTAIAAGGVFAVGDLQEGDRLVGDGSDPTDKRPLATSELAALRARSLLGGAGDGYNEGRGCFGAHACVPGDEAEFQPHSPGHKPYLSRPKRLTPRGLPGGDRREVSQKRWSLTFAVGSSTSFR